MSDRPPLDGWHFTSFVVTDRGPNSAARWRSSVPLARPLSPPDPNPLSVLRFIRQVLRELRVILCQTSRADVASNADIRNFCPKVVTLSTGLFTQSTTSHHLDACFPQTEGPSRPCLGRDVIVSPPTFDVAMGSPDPPIDRNAGRRALTSDLCPMRAPTTSRCARRLVTDRCRRASGRDESTSIVASDR